MSVVAAAVAEQEVTITHHIPNQHTETIRDSFENAERIIGVSQRYPELSILYNASFGSNNVRLGCSPWMFALHSP